MPTISMFYGILVLMFFRDNRRHYLPHIHVRYQDAEAAIAIEDGLVLDGALPPKQLKLVQAWLEIHKEELFVTGSLRCKAKSRSASPLCSEVAHVARRGFR